MALNKPIAPLQELNDPQMNHGVVFVKTQKKGGSEASLEGFQQKNTNSTQSVHKYPRVREMA